MQISAMSSPISSSGARLRGSNGGPCISAIIASRVGPSNVLVKVSSWYSTAPRLHTSDRTSGGAPTACSGAMYPGVPIMEPYSVSASGDAVLIGRPDVRVSSGSARKRAMPQSSKSTSPNSPRMMLAGLMSRWSTLRLWA